MNMEGDKRPQDLQLSEKQRAASLFLAKWTIANLSKASLKV